MQTKTPSYDVNTVLKPNHSLIEKEILILAVSPELGSNQHFTYFLQLTMIDGKVHYTAMDEHYIRSQYRMRTV